VNNPNAQVDIFGLDCHHIATNKSSKWSEKFRELFNKYGLGKFKNGKPRKDVLNDPLNKVKVPGHKGPHPDEMHEQVYNELLNAGNKEAAEKVLKDLAKEAQQVGSELNKILTKTL
jgi:hypothetical protein